MTKKKNRPSAGLFFGLAFALPCSDSRLIDHLNGNDVVIISER